jgi:hypothetical protein
MHLLQINATELRERQKNNMTKNWETIIASVTIEIGAHTFRASLIRRGETPKATYHIMRHGAYQEFDGKNDDNTATVLGLTQIALLLGRELDEFASPKGPEAEQ